VVENVYSGVVDTAKQSSKWLYKFIFLPVEMGASNSLLTLGNFYLFNFSNSGAYVVVSC